MNEVDGSIFRGILYMALLLWMCLITNVVTVLANVPLEGVLWR